MYWPDLEALFTVFDGLKWSRHEPTLSRHTREINVGPLEPRRLWREDGGVRVNIEHGVATDKAYVGCCLTNRIIAGEGAQSAGGVPGHGVAPYGNVADRVPHLPRRPRPVKRRDIGPRAEPRPEHHVAPHQPILHRRVHSR